MDPVTLIVSAAAAGAAAALKETAAQAVKDAYAALKNLLQGRYPAVDFHPLMVDWDTFGSSTKGLYVWEAFVSGAAKAGTHLDDATVAVINFCDALPDPWQLNAVHAESPLSLIGAAALWAGWSDNCLLLQTPCLVLRAIGPR